MERYSQHARYLNIVRAVDLPPLCSGKSVTEAVTTILAKYDSLRTTYSLAGEEPLQVVTGGCEANIRFVEVTEDIASATRDLSNEMRRIPLGADGGLPCSTIVLTLDGRSARALLAFSHTVVDASSAQIIVGEITRLLMSGSVDNGAGTQPRERAFLESGERFWAQNERSVNTWIKRLSDVSGPFRSPRPQEREPQNGCAQAVVRVPLAADRLRRLEEKYQLASSAVLVSLTALTLAAVTDLRRIPLQVLSSNRYATDSEGYVGLLAQVGPLIVDTGVSGLALRSFVDRVGKQLWGSYKAALWSPDDLDAALQDKGLTFADLAGWPTYNDVRGVAPSFEGPHRPVPEGVVEWMKGWPYQDGRFSIAVTSSSHTLCLAVRADTAYVSPELILRFLRLFSKNLEAVTSAQEMLQADAIRLLEDGQYRDF
ncbi:MULTISPECIES: condensation domain-containing protein [unclassified Nocardiopsis]|nr:MULTISPECIES: condensation domain-containing protein [unclassified Nocardiopsis]